VDDFPEPLDRVRLNRQLLERVRLDQRNRVIGILLALDACICRMAIEQLF